MQVKTSSRCCVDRCVIVTFLRVVSGLGVSYFTVEDKDVKVIDPKSLETELKDKLVAKQVILYLTCGRYGADAISEVKGFVIPGKKFLAIR